MTAISAIGPVAPRTEPRPRRDLSRWGAVLAAMCEDYAPPAAVRCLPETPRKEEREGAPCGTPSQ